MSHCILLVYKYSTAPGGIYIFFGNIFYYKKSQRFTYMFSEFPPTLRLQQFIARGRVSKEGKIRMTFRLILKLTQYAVELPCFWYIVAQWAIIKLKKNFHP